MYIRRFLGLNIAATTVVPMPWYSRERVLRSKICRFATRMPVSSRFSSSDRLVSKWKGHVTSSFAVVRKNSEMVSVAIFDATSPARWPPIPSATTYKSYSLSTTNESSLCSRWSPTSLSPAAIARIKWRRSSNGKRLSSVDKGVKVARCRSRAGTQLDASDLEDVLFFVRDHRVDLLHRVGHGLFGLLLRAVDVVRAGLAVGLDGVEQV